MKKIIAFLNKLLFSNVKVLSNEQRKIVEGSSLNRANEILKEEKELLKETKKNLNKNIKDILGEDFQLFL
ncbi:hypothetical protein T190115A13A_90018 [Tenacibaculum sp. 190524A02b]|uniref:Uncharacterized protein n=1 Tax=Tenacibaculum vairaonense TaxID=3137860 RepID=A0ABP1FJK7_9FLAO